LEAPKVFISYSHKDEAWKERLVTQLNVLGEQGLLDIWDDTRIDGGDDWFPKIQEAMESAAVAILLVSADSLTSKFILRKEVPPLLERRAKEGLLLLPLIVRPCPWQEVSWLARLQARPRKGKPLITMPDADAETALSDLATEILHLVKRTGTDSATDMTVTAAQSADPESPGIQTVVHNLPFAQNANFTGRENILERIESTFGQEGAVAITQPQAIHGLGGIGKTQIALEFAHQHLSQFKYVFWLGAENEATISKSLGEVAALLDLPQRHEKEKAVLVAAVRSWFETHNNWLLIFDNAEDAASVQSYLPRTQSGCVIITTRASAMGGIAQPVEVDELDPDSAVKFLFKRAAIKKPDSSQKSVAREICHRFGYMPLAIDHASAYLEETKCSLENYAKYLDKHGVKILQGKQYASAAYGKKTVEATWAISIERLKETNPSAVALLTASSYLAPDDIPIGLFKADPESLPDSLKKLVTEDHLFDQTLGELQKFSLIRRRQGEDTFSMHRLVQSVIRESQDEDESKAWLNSLLGCLKASTPAVNDFHNWPVLESLSSHAASLFTEADKLNHQTEILGRLLNEFAYYLDDRADYAAAEPLYQRALKIDEDLLGPDHPDVATSLNNLAELYRVLGRFAEAEPLYLRALMISEEALGQDHPYVAIWLNNLALLYDSQGRYEEAEPLYLRALKITEKALGPDHSKVATRLNNLAALYDSLGRYEEAEPMYKRALEINEKALGGDHPRVAAGLNNLALLYDNQGRYAEAESMYKRALKIDEQALGSEHPDLATDLNNLAELYRSQGRHAEAEPLFLQALLIFQSVLGETHPNTIAVLRNIAIFYHEWGKKDEAAEYAQLAEQAKTEGSS